MKYYNYKKFFSQSLISGISVMEKNQLLTFIFFLDIRGLLDCIIYSLLNDTLSSNSYT